MDNQMMDPKYLALIQAGLGILAGNTGRQPVGATIGQGLLGGVAGYQQNLQQQQDYALKKQMADYQGQEISWKQKEHQQKLDAAKKQEEMNNNILASLGIGIPASSSTQVDYTPTNFNVLERQSGDMPAQQKPKAMDRDALYKLGLATSLTGGHGGDALIKYADSQKPNWQNVGGKLVDANQYQGEIPIAPTPMTEQQKMQGTYEGWYKPEQETTSPKVVNNGTPKSYLSNPNLSPKAKEALIIKEETTRIENETKSKNKGLSVAAQKELIDTEDAIEGSKEAIKSFTKALELNKSAMGGLGAQTTAKIGSILPEFARPSTIDKTIELDNVLQGSALPSLKAIFGGMPTEGERAILLEVQGSSSQPPSVREGIFNRALNAANRRIQYNTEKAKQLRNGTYFTEEGGIDVNQSQNIIPKDEKMPSNTYTALPKKAPKGQIVRNPKTGERKQFDGLIWKTIK